MVEDKYRVEEFTQTITLLTFVGIMFLKITLLHNIVEESTHGGLLSL